MFGKFGVVFISRIKKRFSMVSVALFDFRRGHSNALFVLCVVRRRYFDFVNEFVA